MKKQHARGRRLGEFRTRGLGVCAISLLWVTIAQAQYTANFQTNIISGVTSNWTNPAGYVIGSNFVFDALIIQNGGVLSNAAGYVGFEVGANNNSALVSGSGSAWATSGNLFVGLNGVGNTLTITNGGAVTANGVLDVLGGTLFLSGGQMSVTQLLVTNGIASKVSFTAGTLNTGGAAVTNGQVFVVGDAVDPATLNLLGGTLAFDAGIDIAINATLTGSGVVSGSITNSGLILANGGTLAFLGGSVRTNASTANTLTNSTLVITNGGAVIFSGSNAWTLAGTVANGGGADGGSIINSNGGVGNTLFFNNPSLRNNNGTLMVVGNVGVNYTQIGSEMTNTYIITGNGTFTGNFGNNNFGVINQGTIATLTGGTLTFDPRDAFNVGGLRNDTNGIIVIASGSILALRRTPNAWTNATAKFPTNSGTIFLQGGTFLGEDTNAVPGHASLYVNSGLGLIHGCGTFENFNSVQNNGTMIADCGTLTFTGILTNNGTWQALNGSVLEAFGLVVNNGTINISGGGTDFVGGFVNNGTIISNTPLPVITSIQVSNHNALISFTTVSSATYTVETNQNLVTGIWGTLTNGVDGTGGIVTITDPGITSVTNRFYRVGSP
jgi:T5SS/PEP-CTERM-associated repeat protein